MLRTLLAKLYHYAVALFVGTAAEPAQARPVSAEIIETGFFPLDALPSSASDGTRRRLAELQDPHLSTWGLW